MTQTQIKQLIDAPLGFTKSCYTPWGSVERCQIVAMPGFAGKEMMASVSRPTTNHGVQWSVFRVTEANFVS